MQKFWKSVKIWQSYIEFEGGTFFLRHSVVYMKGSGDTHSPGVQAKIRYHSPHAAIVYSLQFRCHLRMKEMEQAATVLGRSPQTVHRRNSDFVTAFHPDGRIILLCLTFALKKWTSCCNCDFVCKPTVLQLPQKSYPAKSGSGRILGAGYPNPVSRRKSISVHP